ncbi:putative glycolipid-binding domain-containing protein [Falsirhodobacter halotolerans]|uniref:putative glycolipid-binding domain-containing protein n=1 Tax=Falsirhodobacter halotolerans TaxID=1146892 RepID=UPI001FD2E161|nr:putative glycolipid-binding domain-containing protein [Falsirhodobacter halotolerans]MCJ8139458.1 putative glycolipid-binding domain-containing protein [Falsirhodobacter halotolerans]
MATALWKRIDREGHDAALISHDGDELRLEGMAVIGLPAGRAWVSYQVSVLDERVFARVEAEMAGQRHVHRIRRDARGWSLNGRPMGLGHLRHLHFTFTPATHALDLHRAGPQIRHSVGIPAAQFDLGQPRLAEWPQHYRRKDDLNYDYEAPDWSGPLRFDGDGFLSDQPGFWKREG